jgi:phosphoenolpyruvate phosphomutase
MSSAIEKRIRLREGLISESTVVAAGAHDAMTAHLAETHGFDAVFVSGLGVSTMAHAIPDLNLLTMTEVLGAASRMDAATSLPVIADCDSGFGSLNNIIRTVREFERSGISAVSIEDNLFPKRNSLYRGDCRRELIPVEEQARCIRAAKREQDTSEFILIGRVEALIAGHGVDDACRRADAYAEAGADAILIHSRDKTLSEIEGFLSRWQGLGHVPLVAVPTLFPSYTVEELRAKGFSMVIFANQAMRAAVSAIAQTFATLRKAGRADSVDPHIASVDHIFELVGTKGAIEREEGEDGP